MKIGIGNDHVGYEMKDAIINHLKERGFEVVDYGAYSAERCNYPIYGDVEKFIKLLSSIVVRVNNTQENDNESK